MTHFTLIICVILFLCRSASAQIDSSLFRSWSVAVVGNEYGYDTGLGGEISSPGVVNGRVGFRLKASTVWMESYQAANEQRARYHLVEVMAVYQLKPIERARPYIEAGLVEVFPSSRLSDLTSVQGVGIRAGVELFIVTNPKLHIAYYFGGGINHVRAIAEKMESAPEYADGFVFITGLRFYVPHVRSAHNMH